MTDAECECREAFEAWAKDGLAAASPLWRDFSEPFYRQANGNMESPNYCRSFTQGAWLAFKAGGAWNARHPRADAEDRAVVDVDKLANAIGGLWAKSNSTAGANCFTHKNVVEIITCHLDDSRAALKALGGEDGE